MMFSSPSLAGILPEKTLLKNTYELGEIVGEGGMGVVYHAQHQTLGTEFAIKILDAKLGRIPTIRDRFLEEARIQATLRHPNIVKVTDVIEERGVIGFVMEFIPGYTLDAYIYDVRGALPVEEARDIIIAVLDAIGHAHKAGIIHRDLKPSNILIGKNYKPGNASKTVRVMDFGIAKNLDASIGRTVTGAKMGTPRYMAPEQVENASAVDCRADIYALGLTLYEMLCARTPFEDESDYGLLRAHLQKSPPPPSQYRDGIPPKLEALVLTALEKNPDHRFASAEAFSNALRKLELGPSHSSRTRAAYPETSSKSTRRVDEERLKALASGAEPDPHIDTPKDSAKPKKDNKKRKKKPAAAAKDAQRSSNKKKKEPLEKGDELEGASPKSSKKKKSSPKNGEKKKSSSSKKKHNGTSHKKKHAEAQPERVASKSKKKKRSDDEPADSAKKKSNKNKKKEPKWVFEDTLAAGLPDEELSRIQEFDPPRHGKLLLWLGLFIGASVIALVVAFRQLEGPVQDGATQEAGAHQERRAPLGQELQESTPFQSIEVLEKSSGKMSRAPAHEHLVGRLADDPDAGADERMAKRIQLGAFYIDQTEVRQSQYALCVQAKICPPLANAAPPEHVALHNHPVTGVTFEDAKRYCDWAGKRLPDENEWEAAARAGQDRLYPFQGRPDCQRINYQSTPAERSADPRCQEMNLLRTVSVYDMEDGKNELHLRHMAGNVREWTSSSPQKGHRILKGGSFKTSRQSLRVSAREIVREDAQADDLGFRCVLDAR